MLNRTIVMTFRGVMSDCFCPSSFGKKVMGVGRKKMTKKLKSWEKLECQETTHPPTPNFENHWVWWPPPLTYPYPSYDYSFLLKRLKREESMLYKWLETDIISRFAKSKISQVIIAYKGYLFFVALSYGIKWWLGK